MTYVCLLRGINVSGKNLVKMDALRAAFEAHGFADVETYVQSGNVVFDGKKAPPGELAAAIEALLSKSLRCEARALVLDGDRLAATIRNSPFLPRTDEKTLHVTFLGGKPSAAGLRKLAAIDAGNDRFVAVGAEIHLTCPDGYGRSKLTNNVLERLLGVHATTRNWRTVTTLAGLVAARGR